MRSGAPSFSGPSGSAISRMDQVLSSVVALDLGTETASDSFRKPDYRTGSAYLSFDDPLKRPAEHRHDYKACRLVRRPSSRPTCRPSTALDQTWPPSGREVFATIMSRPDIRAGITRRNGAGRGDTSRRCRYESGSHPEFCSDPERVSPGAGWHRCSCPYSGEVVLAVISCTKNHLARPAPWTCLSQIRCAPSAVATYMEFPLSSRLPVGLLYDGRSVVGGSYVGYELWNYTWPSCRQAGRRRRRQPLLNVFGPGDSSPTRWHHYYWHGSNADWVDEGAAEFMASLVSGTAGLEHARPTATFLHHIQPCEEHCRIGDPFLPKGRCRVRVTNSTRTRRNSSFWTSIAKSLGESRFRQSQFASALRDLTVWRMGLDDHPGTPVDMGHVRQSFGPGGGVVVCRNRAVVRRDRCRLDLSGIGDEPVVRSLPGIDGRSWTAPTFLLVQPRWQLRGIGEL